MIVSVSVTSGKKMKYPVLTNNDCVITECKNKPILLTQDYLSPSVLFTEG